MKQLKILTLMIGLLFSRFGFGAESGAAALERDPNESTVPIPDKTPVISLNEESQHLSSLLKRFELIRMARISEELGLHLEVREPEFLGSDLAYIRELPWNNLSLRRIIVLQTKSLNQTLRTKLFSPRNFPFPRSLKGDENERFSAWASEVQARMIEKLGIEEQKLPEFYLEITIFKYGGEGARNFHIDEGVATTVYPVVEKKLESFSEHRIVVNVKIRSIKSPQEAILGAQNFCDLLRKNSLGEDVSPEVCDHFLCIPNRIMDGFKVAPPMTPRFSPSRWDDMDSTCGWDHMDSRRSRRSARCLPPTSYLGSLRSVLSYEGGPIFMSGAVHAGMVPGISL